MFARRLKALRRTQGFTQQNVADRIDLSVDAISNLERAKSLPSFTTIIALADVFSVSLAALFDFDSSELDREQREMFEEAKAILSRLPAADLKLALDQLKAIQRHIA